MKATPTGKWVDVIILSNHTHPHSHTHTQTTENIITYYPKWWPAADHQKATNIQVCLFINIWTLIIHSTQFQEQWTLLVVCCSLGSQTMRANSQISFTCVIKWTGESQSSPFLRSLLLLLCSGLRPAIFVLHVIWHTAALHLQVFFLDNMSPRRVSIYLSFVF